jgi:hypothetical protein
MNEPLSQEQLSQIHAAIFSRQKIQAIKLHREFTKVGLAESKTYVEALEATLLAQNPSAFAPPSKGCALNLVCLAAMLGMAVGVWWRLGS